MPWVTFKERFLAKYFPKEEMDNKEKEFIELSQETRTVREYITKFECLSHFAPHMIDTPRKKVKKYH